MKHLTLADFPIPEATQLEAAVIGSMVSMADTIPTVMRSLNDECFANEKAAQAWKAIKEMDKAREVINFVTVSSKAGVDKDFLLNTISSEGLVYTDAGMVDLCKQLRSAALHRKCYQAAVHMLTLSQRMEDEPIFAIPDKLATAFSDELNDDSLEHIAEVFARIKKNADMTANGEIVRIPTGFASLDDYCLGGWLSGQLIILASRPSVGKTAILLQMAKAAAASKVPTAVFSLEMENEQLGQRLLASTGKVWNKDFASGVFAPGAFDEACRQFNGQPLYLNDKVFGADELISKIRHSHQMGRCGIAFIDYLGLLSGGARNQNRVEFISDVTRRLKNLSKELRIPIVLLCQLNRASASEKRSPELYDLRESGSIEQDADIVLMLESPSEEQIVKKIGGDLGQQMRSEQMVFMWLRKNRQNEKGLIILHAVNGYTKFDEINGTSDYNENEITLGDMPF